MKYTFQLNIMGSCEKPSLDDLRQEIFNRFKNLSEEDIEQFTDVYFVNSEGAYVKTSL